MLATTDVRIKFVSVVATLALFCSGFILTPALATSDFQKQCCELYGANHIGVSLWDASTRSGAHVCFSPLVEVLGSHSCPHCQRADAFFKSSVKQFPGMNYIFREISQDQEAAKIVSENGGGVPVIKFGRQLILGFNEEEIVGKIYQTEVVNSYA